VIAAWQSTTHGLSGSLCHTARVEYALDGFNGMKARQIIDAVYSLQPDPETSMKPQAAMIEAERD